MSSRSPSGRSLVPLLAVALIAVGAIVVLMFGDQFGSGGDALDQEGAGPGAGNLDGAGRPGAGAEDPETGAAGLVGRYGAGDLGAVRLRLLHVTGSAPLADQPLTLAARSGGEQNLTTGPDGVAIFGGVVPSRGYRLDIRGEGHAPVTIQGIRVLRAETTDLGDIIVGAHVVLRGRVVDGSGRALPGSSVAVYTSERGILADGFFSNMVAQATKFPAPVEQVLTDDGGWFVLTSLADGAYRLEARRSGYATRYETDVVVSQDRPAKAMKIVLGEAATVTGHVRDEQDKPVAAARVVAIKDSGSRFFGSATLERDIALTDASGRYTIDTLTQGVSYRFGVMAEGYTPIFEMNAEEIRGHHHEKDFQLVLGGSISGVVRRAGDGQPIQGATVLAAMGRMPFGPGRRGNSEDMRIATATAKTDEQGRFRLANVFPGPVFTAQVKAFGYVPYTASQWQNNVWGEVVAGGQLEVEVELEKGGAIQGSVLDGATRQPLAGAEVTVLPRGRNFFLMFSGMPHANTDAEGHYELVGVQPGEWGVMAVASGYAPSDPQDDASTVTITEAGGVADLDVGLERAGSVTGIVTDTNGEPIAAARVRTRRAPQAGGGPGGRRGGRRGGRMGGMRSFLPGASGVDLTDQEGRFVIDDVSSDERWVLRAEAEGYVETTSEPFQIRAGEQKAVNISVVGGGTLEGRVLDDRGGFVEGAKVRVGHLPTDRASQPRLRAWEVDRYLSDEVYHTDEGGRFRATDVTPGIGVVKAEHDGFVTYYKRGVIIRSDETVENYMIPLVRGDTMTGVVKDTSGRPVEGAAVGITKGSMPGEQQEEELDAEESEEIEPRLSGRSDANGKFTIENVPPGVYTVAVWWAPGYQGWGQGRSEGAIRRGIASSATTVEFRLEPSTSGGGR